MWLKSPLQAAMAPTTAAGAFFELDKKLAACKALASTKSIGRLGKGLRRMTSMAFVHSCVPAASSHPGLDSIDRIPSSCRCLRCPPSVARCFQEHATTNIPRAGRLRVSCSGQRCPCCPAAPRTAAAAPRMGSARASSSACCLAALGRRDG